MSWSIWRLFRTPDDLFRRHEENRLMLEQYLAVLEARFVLLSGGVAEKDRQVLEEVKKVVEAYRAYRSAKPTPNSAPLPDWNEAFLADQLLSRLLPPEEARSELVAQLAALKAVDPTMHTELSAEWEAIKRDNPDDVGARAPALLVSALRATQWKNTQNWIVRSLGTRYAVRLRNAFLLALIFGVLLVFADTILGPRMRSAALSGLGFAAAAGLLGATFSAMVGRERAFKLDNIEEARAATSTQMIALRMGVGVAAAIIVYFFFESGLVEGALFPDLGQIGFGRVTPLGSDLDGLRANAQSLDLSTGTLVQTIEQARQKIDAVLTSMPAVDAAANKIAEAQRVATRDLAANQLMEKLQVTGADLVLVSAQLEELKAEWALGSRPLGSLAPNSDLSKLVVWCFAAGFTQTLVPSLLAKVSLPADSQS